MRTIWDLPREDMIVPNGREWLLHLLAMLPEIQRAMVLMILWRIWHVHNEITHDKLMPPVEGSKRFLASYLDCLLMTKQEPNADPIKGKVVLSYNHVSVRVAKHTKKRQRAAAKWLAPREGMAKLNIDGSFVNYDEAGAGMVLRDQHGTVIVAAARQLINCTDALDAELAAIEEGLALPLNWTSMNLSVETDCA
jgi:hypothetical protein